MYGEGTYNAEGIKAIADAMGVSHSTRLCGASQFAEYRSLTAVDTRQNGIDGEGTEQLAAAVLDSFSMVTFGEVPIKELRADTLTTLDLSRKDLGPTEAIVLAGLLSVSRSLSQVCPIQPIAALDRFDCLASPFPGF